MKHEDNEDEYRPIQPNFSKYECRICHAHATGFHFEAQSCSACAAFFRRAIALKRNYKCKGQLTGKIQKLCTIFYTERVLCKACRLEKCLTAGMKKNAVQSTKETRKRSYCTKSGLQRNKQFATAGVSTVIKKVGNPSSSPPEINAKITVDDSQKSESKLDIKLEYFKSSIHTIPNKTQSKIGRNSFDIQSIIATDSYDKSLETIAPKCLDFKSKESAKSPSEFQLPSIASSSDEISKVYVLFSSENILRIFVEEEMRIAERRRFLFCERPVSSLIGSQSKACPYTSSDIKPLSFRDFRKSIRTNILLIYEWLRVWPEYSLLAKEDQVTLLRKCVLYHTILDPCYLTYQFGDTSKFVLPNGGYVSTHQNGVDGWEDELEISNDIKKKIYWPLLTPLSEIVAQFERLKLQYEEFVALKAFVSFKMTMPDVSKKCRAMLKQTLDQICQSFYDVLEGENDMDKAERFGNILLLLSPIFDTATYFVECHHQVQFFDLWEIDSLMVQFLKNKS